MDTDIDIGKLERKVYGSFQQDGLLDMGIGLIITTFGISMAYDMAYMPGIIAGVGIPVWPRLQKRFLARRIGHVSFGEARQARMRREKTFYKLFFAATALLGIGAFFVFAKLVLPTVAELIVIPGLGPSLFSRDLLTTFVLAPIAVIGALTFATLAYWKQAPRFYGYAVWSLAVVFAGPLVGIEPPIYGVIWGAGITISGIVLLARFIARHPVIREEDS